MFSSRVFAWVLGIGVMVAAVVPRMAEACSPPSCVQGGFVPAGAQVPVNVSALFWRPSVTHSMAVDPGAVGLALATDPTTPLPITTTQAAGGYVVVPGTPLVEGASYVLTDRDGCSGPATATFTAATAQPLPGELGALTVAQRAEEVHVATSSGSCTAPAMVDLVDVELQPAATATPWLHALRFQVLVDGVAYRQPMQADAAARVAARVFHTCSSLDGSVDTGLAPGMHSVAIEASLPGSALTWTSIPVTIDLGCVPGPENPEDPDPPADAGGCSATGARAAPWLLGLVLLLIRRRRRR